MASSKFRLPDELFQEVLVSKFSEDVHIVEKEERTVIPFTPLVNEQRTRVTNVSKVFFSTNIAKQFLENAYKFLKDSVFSYEDIERQWGKYESAIVNHESANAEDEEAEEVEKHQSLLIRIFKAFLFAKRVVNLIRNTIESIKKIESANEKMNQTLEPFSFSYNGFFSLYKRTTANALNLATETIKNHIVFVLETFKDFIKVQVFEHLPDILRMAAKAKNLIKEVIKGAASKSIKKIVKCTVKAATGVRTATTGVGLAVSVVLWADTAKDIYDAVTFFTELPGQVRRINDFIDNNIVAAIDKGISTLQDIQDSVVGFKNPAEKIMAIYDNVSKNEAEISFTRLIPSVTQNIWQRRVALVNILMGRFFNNFNFVSDEELERFKREVLSNVLFQEIRKAKFHKDFDSLVSDSFSDYVKNFKSYSISNLHFERFLDDLPKLQTMVGGGMSEGDPLQVELNDRRKLVHSRDFIDSQPEEVSFVTRVYNLTTEAFIDVVQTAFNENIQARGSWLNELKDLGKTLENQIA